MLSWKTERESEAGRFWRRAIAFVLLQFFLAAFFYGIFAYRESRFHFTNANTHSVLRPIYHGIDYGVVILGTSRARNFAKSNHHAVEEELGQKVMNLSRNGAGIVPQSVALRTFFGRGNHAEFVVYFLDPWVFYFRDWNETLPFGNEEPWAVDFAFQLLAHRVPVPLIAEYYYTKFSPSWWLEPPPVDIEPSPPTEPHRDADSVANRLTLLYHRRGVRTADLNQPLFRRYSRMLEELVEEAGKRGAKRVFLILPPTLLEYEPGREVLWRFLQERWPKSPGSAVTVLDHSGALPSPDLYESLDHLNPGGIRKYTNKFQRPLIAGTGGGSSC
jgi:hypothetical protein